MKLKSIASAIAVLGMGLSCAAWSQIAADPATGITTVTPYVAANPADGVARQNLEVTTTPFTAPVANGTPVSSTRQDTVSIKNGVTSQTLNKFTTQNYTVTGSSTIGVAGGVSGLGVLNTTTKYTKGDTTTAFTGGETIAAGTVYFAGSKINGVVQLVSGKVGTAGAIASAGDSLIAATVSTTVPTKANVGTGIKGTDHDFATKVVDGNIGSVGLCTYCHTPHKASSTLLLWNKTMSLNQFKWDVPATTAGTKLTGFDGTNYSGPSAKCLACHDGSVAIGDIGWFAGAGRTGSAAVNMNAKDMYQVSDRFVMGPDGNLGKGAVYKTALGSTAAFGGSAVHPVAIPYPLNGAPNVYNGSTTGARLATNDFVSDPTANNIRLYADVGGGAIVGKVIPGQTGMECSSCHDVHNKAATDKYFLRGKMVGATQADGYICAQCHTK